MSSDKVLTDEFKIVLQDRINLLDEEYEVKLTWTQEGAMIAIYRLTIGEDITIPLHDWHHIKDAVDDLIKRFEKLKQKLGEQE